MKVKILFLFIFSTGNYLTMPKYAKFYNINMLVPKMNYLYKYSALHFFLDFI